MSECHRPTTEAVPEAAERKGLGSRAPEPRPCPCPSCAVGSGPGTPLLLGALVYIVGVTVVATSSGWWGGCHKYRLVKRLGWGLYPLNPSLDGILGRGLARGPALRVIGTG